MGKCNFAKLGDGMGFPGADHVRIRLVLLEHHPHGLHIIPQRIPNALGFQVAEPQFPCLSKLDARHAVRDLAGDEFQPAPGLS